MEETVDQYSQLSMNPKVGGSNPGPTGWTNRPHWGELSLKPQLH